MQPQDFFEIGISVIPVFLRSKKPMISWQKYQKELPTEAQIGTWFRPRREINAAVICGWHGLTVLDFDNLQPYCAWLAWAIAEGGKAREAAVETYRVRTARGMHVYLFSGDTPRCGKFDWGDIKARGGYVLIPPSIHPSGTKYEAVDDSATILSVKSLGDVIPNPPAPEIERVEVSPVVNVFSSSDLWPQTIVEEIKQRTPILSYFPEARQTGHHHYRTCCPFHDDSDPSFWIDSEKGICGCYSGCTVKPLDVIALHARLHNLSNREAIKEMAKEVNY